MTEPSEVDPVVLAGEPDSVHALEGGDDDLPPLRTAAPPPDGEQWASADGLLEGQPTELGEPRPRR